jgi:hypothetical protein
MGVTTCAKDGVAFKAKNTTAMIIAVLFIWLSGAVATLTAYMSRIINLALTPAMAAGVSDRIRSLEEVVEQMSK